jgi:hypothetical protein
MRYLLWSIILAALVLVFTAPVATADKQLSVTPLETIEPTPINLGQWESEVSCQVGNLNAAAWAINNFLLPPEDYKLVFDPMTTCTVCPLGFKVTKVHAFLQVTAACTIILSVDVERTMFTTPGCHGPGTELCATGLYQVNLPSAGLWNIGIPVNPTDCPNCGCLAMGQKYLLSVHFESTSCSPVPSLITDAGPATLCTNWNNYGAGWYDIVAAFPTWPGQLKFFADAECCNPPTAIEGNTWGRVKSVFR